MAHVCQHAEIGDTFIAESSNDVERYRASLKRYGFTAKTEALPEGRRLVTVTGRTPVPRDPALRAVIAAAAALPKGKTHVFEHAHTLEAYGEREKMMRILRRECGGAKFQIRLRERHYSSARARFALIRTA